MENLEIKHLRKKNLNIGFRLTIEEREAVEQFCELENISITNFFRYATRKVINEKTTKWNESCFKS